MNSSELHEFLPDSTGGVNPSYVFIKLWPTDKVKTTEEAMEYLRNNAPLPVHLSLLPRGKNMTVVVRASEAPRIEFGRSVPTDNYDADFDEIVEILRANDVQAIR